MSLILSEFNFKKQARYLLKKIRDLFKSKQTAKGNGYQRLFSEEEQRLKMKYR